MSKILIIRFSSIGDIILTTPIIRGVKLQLNAEVHFLVKPSFKALLSHNPYIDKIHTYIPENDRVLDILKHENFDYILDLQKNVKSRLLSTRLGVKTLTFDKLNIKKWILVNTKVNLLPDKHIVDRYYEAVAPLNIKNDGLGLDFFFDEAEFDKAQMILNGISHYQVLVLGANYFTKRIPISKCEEMIQTANELTILVGGKDVEQVAEELSSKLPDTTMNLVNKVNLNISAAILKNATRIITGDTGMMHIGAALQKEMVVLWGNTVPQFGMYPYYGNKSHKKAQYLEVENLNCRPCSKLGYNACPKSHFKCMLDIDASNIHH
ncbi:MAG: glycosyltransferase family 9 protein [Saprospiraceae bacterium]